MSKGYLKQFDLPEPVIQLIQSFLAAKEAAQTALLSKSWGGAWLTRPNLDFDLTDFCPKSLEFVIKALERYENFNLEIESFGLRIKNPPCFDTAAKFDHTELVNRALKLGPTRLSFESETFFSYEICDIDDHINYHSLTSLALNHVNFQTSFLDHLSSIFPSLKDLTLSITKAALTRSKNSKDRETILISSPTLERLDFHMGDDMAETMVKLDLPSIRNLSFVCSSIPKLSVKSRSKGWEESYVSVSNVISASWFYALSRFIRKLMRFSRIFLSLHVHSLDTFDYEPGKIRGLPTPEIENLTIYDSENMSTLSYYVLFDGLFRMCHPKVITQYMPNIALSIGRPEANNIRFLGKRLLEARDAKVLANQYMYGLNDLKEARAQVFNEDFDEWRREESIDALSNYWYYSPTPEEYRHPKIRFRLNW